MEDDQAALEAATQVHRSLGLQVNPKPINLKPKPLKCNALGKPPTPNPKPQTTQGTLLIHTHTQQTQTPNHTRYRVDTHTHIQQPQTPNHSRYRVDSHTHTHTHNIRMYVCMYVRIYVCVCVCVYHAPTLRQDAHYLKSAPCAPSVAHQTQQSVRFLPNGYTNTSLSPKTSLRDAITHPSQASDSEE